MLKLIKEGVELSKDDMVDTTAGDNCGSVGGCDCGTGRYMTLDQRAKYSGKQYLDYWVWDAVEY